MTMWNQLAQTALAKSMEVRRGAGRDLVSPLCVFGLCDDVKVPVRFVDVNMEGMYKRSGTPRILVSALRPPPRRVFTTAHELGHHVFGHGSTIDELIDETREGTTANPNEFLVNAFAGFLLMPTLGVRNAFVRRGLDPATATPEQMFTIACSFGVGYETLVSHLCFGLRMITRPRAAVLRKSSPKSIRASLLGGSCDGSLVIVDEHWTLPTVDVEIGNRLLLPTGVTLDRPIATCQEERQGGCLFAVTKSGIARAQRSTTPWAVFVRSSRPQYVGLAQYRHLEPDEDD